MNQKMKEKAYFCKNCCTVTLYITEEEKALIEEFGEEKELEKRTTYKNKAYKVYTTDAILGQSPAKDKIRIKDELALKDKFKYEMYEKYTNLFSSGVLGYNGLKTSYENISKITASDLFKSDYECIGTFDLVIQIKLSLHRNLVQFSIRDDDIPCCALCSKSDLIEIKLPCGFEDNHIYTEAIRDNQKKLKDVNQIYKNIAYKEKREFIKNNIDKQSDMLYKSGNVNVQELLANLINTQVNINFLEKELETIRIKEMEQRKLLGSIVDTIKMKNTITIHKPIEPMKPTEPTLRKIRFLNRKNDSAYNEELLKEYELKIQKYNQEQAEFQKELELYESKRKERDKKDNDLNNKIELLLDFKNENLSLDLEVDFSASANEKNDFNLAKHGRIILEENIVKIEQNLIELYKLKNDLISLNVISQKYNNLIVWKKIYDYFETGRVNTLTGPYGAYNLYESEKRADLIIDKLDTISTQLNIIIDNQNKIYNAVKDVNKNLELLNNQMDDQLKLSAITAFNTAQTAYYSKLIAERTNVVAWLTALK